MLGSNNQIKPWLDVAYRRRYWILVPALLGLVGGLVALTQMPKVYLASTTILMKQQSIPQGYVQFTVSTGVLDRLATLSVSVVSRPFLEPVARQFKLIKPDAKEPQIAAAVNRLAMSVTPVIDPIRPPRWFRIDVQNKDPELAANVANSLALTIVNQNTKIREGEATAALATAQQFLAEIKDQLEQQEGQLARYKSDKLWQLPEQLGPNMQLLQGTQQRLSSIDGEIRLLNERINIVKMTPEVSGAPLVAGVPVADPITARYQQLLREQADLEVKYSDIHPDVTRKREEVQAWAKAYPQVLAPPKPTSTPGDEAPKGLTPNEIQIAQAQGQIKKLEMDKRELEGQMGTFQSRITSAPTRQQEMEILSRGLETLRTQYANWLQKETDAKRALDLERANRGEQFQIQDIAHVPQVPYKPVAYQVILGGLFIGLAFGVGLSFLLEFLDNSVRTEEEFQTAFPELPLLAAIPDLDRASRSRKRKSSGRRAAAAVVLFLALGGLTSLSGSLPFLR